MAVSEAIYGITTSYVSSSAYYGFVPQNNQHSNLQSVVENCNSNSTSCCWDANTTANVNTKEAPWNENTAVGAMETDDEMHDVNIVNNYCVIPEDLRGFNAAGVVYHYNYLDGRNNPVPGFVGSYRQTHQDAGVGRPARNRKRNNDGELMPIEPDQLKRGSGNCSTYHGRRFSKDDGGLAKVYYKSSRLFINGEKHENMDIKNEDDFIKTEKKKEEEFITFESRGCCWAAGNHSSLIVLNNHAKDEGLLLLNGNSKLRRDSSDLEYEKMLLETHGCSAYHHQRIQLENNGISESEF